MCLVSYYQVAHCGCPIPEEDQMFTMACMDRLFHECTGFYYNDSDDSSVYSRSSADSRSLANPQPQDDRPTLRRLPRIQQSHVGEDGPAVEEVEYAEDAPEVQASDFEDYSDFLSFAEYIEYVVYGDEGEDSNSAPAAETQDTLDTTGTQQFETAPEVKDTSALQEAHNATRVQEVQEVEYVGKEQRVKDTQEDQRIEEVQEDQQVGDATEALGVENVSEARESGEVVEAQEIEHTQEDLDLEEMPQIPEFEYVRVDEIDGLLDVLGREIRGESARGTADVEHVTTSRNQTSQSPSESQGSDSKGVVSGHSSKSGGQSTVVTAEYFARPKQDGPRTSSRMCRKHEAEFESRLANYFASELLELRTNVGRRGSNNTIKEINDAKMAAGRLWDRYMAWKFFNGGDGVAAARIRAPNFYRPLPKHRSRHSYTEERAIFRILAEANVDYSRLKNGFHDLLKPLRDDVHPDEMTGH